MNLDLPIRYSPMTKHRQCLMEMIRNSGFNSIKLVVMKKQYLSLIAIALVAMTACTVNDLDEPTFKPETGNGSKQTVTIHANLPEQSRAIHGTEEGETSFSWVAGEDQVGVSIKNDDWWEYSFDPCAYRFTNTTNGDKATFVSDPALDYDIPNMSVGSTIVSYYPYGTALFCDYVNEECIGQPMLRNALGALLQIGDNTTDHLYRGDYMFSRPVTLTEENFDSEGNVNVSLEFGHIFAKMRFTVKNSTSKSVDISSLIYRSTNKDDVMQGTLYLNAATGEFVTPEYGEYGDIAPSNSSVLEVQDVTIAPGETATLWMWMMPLDFTEGNAAGRKADIMVNTQLGTFRVQNANFNTRFVAGNVYRQGLELTEDKLMEDYAYISDPNFVRILYQGDMENHYDEETGDFVGVSVCPLYDLDLQPYPALSEDIMWGENMMNFTEGCFLKISEAAKLESMRIAVSYGVNVLSLDGLQYFTGLKFLDIQLGSDMNAAMAMRALKFSTLTNLEDLNIMQTRVFRIDLSHNTKLVNFSLGEAPQLEAITGLEKLSALKTFGIGEVSPKFALDLSETTSLEYVAIGWSQLSPSLNLSGLNLLYLSLSVGSMENVVSNNLTCKKLDMQVSGKFPSGAPQGVKELSYYLWSSVDESLFSQFGDMTEIETMELVIGAPMSSDKIAFTAAQSSVKKLTVYQDSSENGTTPPSGWSNLTGLEELTIDSKWSFDESNTLDLSSLSKLTNVSIKAGVLTSFAVPSSALTVVLNVYNSRYPTDINLTSSGVEDLEILTSGRIFLGDAPKLKKVYLVAYNSNNESYGLTLGTAPLLQDAYFNVSKGSIKYNATEYPAVTKLVVTGKNISSIPEATMMPALQDLGIRSGTNISGIDLRGYTYLNNLSLPTDKSFAQGAFKLSEAQFATAKTLAKAKALATENAYLLPYFTGINYTVASPAVYQVKRYYQVLDNSGNEVDVVDADGSDGEITELVY